MWRKRFSVSFLSFKAIREKKLMETKEINLKSFYVMNFQKTFHFRVDENLLQSLKEFIRKSLKWLFL